MFHFLPNCAECAFSVSLRTRDGNQHRADCGHVTGWEAIKHCLDCAKRLDACMFCGASLGAESQALTGNPYDLKPDRTTRHIVIATALGALALYGMYLLLT